MFEFSPNNDIQTPRPRMSQRILVVEDNGDVLDTLCELLTILDLPYRAAKNGEVAFELLDAERDFSILLSDITLTGISGIDLAKKAHALIPGLQVIFMSGYSNLPHTALNFPFLSLPKPYTLDQINDVLEKTYLRMQNHRQVST